MVGCTYVHQRKKDLDLLKEWRKLGGMHACTSCPESIMEREKMKVIRIFVVTMESCWCYKPIIEGNCFVLR